MKLVYAGLSAGLLMAVAAGAIEPLPVEQGWHGYVSPSVVGMEFRDNTVVGLGSLELGNERIESLDARPEKESAGSFSLSGEVGYMFTDPGVYVFVGNRLEDFLRLDNSSALGARLDAGRVGILEASALFSLAPTEVWADPFLTGADREATDRTSTGARFGVAGIGGSRFDASLTVRKVEIDEERSGASLPLTDAERALLRRDGDAARIELLYTWVINPRHILIPAVDFGVYDADGDAVAREGATVQLTHVYQQGRLRLISNAAFRQAEFDEVNPVFGLKQDEEEWVLSVTGIYGNLFDQPNLSGMASLLVAERDSDIGFYDAEATVASVGLLYKF
ncbi:MAG TPA: DUF2860 family protein [Kiritimatiellia bacterium]|nr:DUF2860 family protein [Kiritimatiellia bacterium]